MWGNGLEEKEKFSVLVAGRIADKTQRTVDLISYAHSAALLDGRFGELVNGAAPAYLPFDRAGLREPEGDVNSSLPTVFQQEDCARRKYADAEIVLVDGCINNVGAENIALPFSSSNPARGNSVIGITRATNESCGRMLGLIEKIKLDFPNATIVVMRYYTVVSEKSSFTIGIYSSAFGDALGVLARAANRVTYLVSHKKPFHHTKWEQNSTAFFQASTACFNWAIAAANGWDLPGMHPLPSPECPQVLTDDLHKPALATLQERVYLAAPPDSPDFAFGTGKLSQLWGLPAEHLLGRGHTDHMYGARKALCKQYYFGANGKHGNAYACRVSPIAHPNTAGARAYAESIIGETTATGAIDHAWQLTPSP